MTDFFLIWMYIIIAVLGIFFVALIIDLFTRSRRAQTPEERITARRMVRTFWVVIGTMLFLQNLSALVWPQPSDWVPIIAHVGLTAVGMAGVVVGFTAFKDLRNA